MFALSGMSRKRSVSVLLNKMLYLVKALFRNEPIRHILNETFGRVEDFLCEQKE